MYPFRKLGRRLEFYFLISCKRAIPASCVIFDKKPKVTLGSAVLTIGLGRLKIPYFTPSRASTKT